MVIDCSVVIHPEGIYRSVEQNLENFCSSLFFIPIHKYQLSYGLYFKEWNGEWGDKPDVDHLDVGSLGQAVGHGDEHGGEHQHAGQVHRHHGLEEERLVEVGGVGDADQQQRGNVDCQHGAWC